MSWRDIPALRQGFSSNGLAGFVLWPTIESKGLIEFVLASFWLGLKAQFDLPPILNLEALIALISNLQPPTRRPAP